MHALVVGASPEAGGAAFYRDLLVQAGLLVAADAGAEWCVALGRTPDLAVGDFDSAETGAPARLRSLGVEVQEHSAAKDASDLDLAVSAAIARGASRLTLTACFGGRLDHTLASLGSLMRASVGLAADVQEPSFAAWAFEAPARSGISLSVEPGGTLSVFSLGSAVGVTVRGGTFPLDDATLDPLSSRGLSNIASGTRFSVSASEGSVVVIASVAGSDLRPALIAVP
jgi:thiamine pyrophosphokinase